jgi:hypothetical protein
MEYLIGPFRGSITPAPRTPETQHLSSGARRHLVLQPASRRGGRADMRSPGAATRVALAAGGAHGRIAVADLEVQVIAPRRSNPLWACAWPANTSTDNVSAVHSF